MPRHVSQRMSVLAADTKVECEEIEEYKDDHKLIYGFKSFFPAR